MVQFVHTRSCYEAAKAVAQGTFLVGEGNSDWHGMTQNVAMRNTRSTRHFFIGIFHVANSRPLTKKCMNAACEEKVFGYKRVPDDGRIFK